MMTTFNILGCCVLRDIFRITPNEQYKVLKFAQFVSPISFMEEAPERPRLLPENLDVFSEWSNFARRNILFDMNKGLLDWMAEQEADYYVIDLSELRFPIDKYTLDDGDSFYITRTGYQTQIQDKREHLDLNGRSIINIEECELSDTDVCAVLEKYADELKRLIDENRIIVVENMMQYRHIDDDANRFHEYYSLGIAKKNQALLSYYAFLKKLIPNAHFIKIPDHGIGDSAHLFGKDPLHFTDKYYQYLYKAVTIIVDHEDDERRKLDELREAYSDYFELLEKAKRMEYYITNNTNNLLQDLSFDNVGNGKGWRVATSKASRFIMDQKALLCGDEAANWAVLSQNINLASYAGKSVCFSVKYRTAPGTVLNIAIRYKDMEGKWIYLASKQCVSDRYVNVDSIVLRLPEEDKQYPEAQIAVYVNSDNARVDLFGAKLEIGDFSSLC